MPPFGSVDDWNLEIVRDLLADSTGEPGWYDWKEVLRNRQDPKHNERLCKVACAMANTGGGFIVFGVANKGSAPENRIVGIDLDGEEGHDFGQIIDKVRPRIRFSGKPLSMPSGHGLFVVHVPESGLRPHMSQWDGVFYQRGDGGNTRPMEYQQVRDLMTFTEERRRQMTLLRIEIRQIRDIAKNLQRAVFNERPFTSRVHFDVSGIRPVLANICGMLPSDDLLSTILSIVQLAQFINTHMDDAVRQGYTLAQGAGRENLDNNLDLTNTNIVANLPRLEQRCDDCENELESLFGSLIVPSRSA
jgi:hypothetical protein